MKKEVDEMVNLHLCKSEDKETKIRELQNELDNSYNEAMKLLEHQKWIVIYENDKEFIQMLLGRLQSEGYKYIKIATDPLELGEIMGAMNGKLSAIILDLIMPQMNGLQILEKYKRLPCVKIIFSILNKNDKVVLQALEFADYYCLKDQGIGPVIHALNEAFSIK